MCYCLFVQCLCSREIGVNRELHEQVMIERVELIARLTSEGASQERDREIALNLIAEIARGNLIKSSSFSVVFLPNVHQKKDMED